LKRAKGMRKSGEVKFRRNVKSILEKKNIQVLDLKGQKRKDTLLKQKPFFNLLRRNGKHVPDLLITAARVPCELKSPEEIYDVCHYIRAHFISYLLQIIYGQCLSYADLFRSNDELLSIFLMVPEKIGNNLQGFWDIGAIFHNVLALKTKWQLYLEQMGLRSVNFKAPRFVDERVKNLYGKMGKKPVILVTQITYFLKKPNYTSA
jgi:hypothetical protein